METPIKYLSFNAWYEENSDLEVAFLGTEVDCPSCVGEGERECLECGHESDCEICLGHGVILYDSLTSYDRKCHLTKMWEADKKETERKFLSYKKFLESQDTPSA